LEVAEIANDLSMRLCFQAKNYHLIQAISITGIDDQYSYELLECLGDSVMKLVFSLYLFFLLNSTDESELTAKRVNFINNRLLAILAYQNDVIPYVRTHLKSI